MDQNTPSHEALIERFAFLHNRVPPRDLLGMVGREELERMNWYRGSASDRLSIYQTHFRSSSEQYAQMLGDARLFLELFPTPESMKAVIMAEQDLTPKMLYGNYTPSSTFKRLVALIGKLMPPTTTIFTPAPSGTESLETPVFYRARFLDASIHLEGFLLLPSDDKASSDRESMCVNPEEDFVKNQCFWVASPAQIFRDANPAIDKGRKLAWMAAFDRDCIYEAFCVNLNEPVVSMSFSVKMLERLSEPGEVKTKAKPLLGDVNAARIGVHPALANAAPSAADTSAKRRGADADDMQPLSLTGLSTTLNDGPQDTPPAGTQPTGT